MRAAYLFIIAMCFLFLGGNNYACSGLHHSNLNAPVQHGQKHQIRFTDNNRGRTYVKSTNLNDKKDILLDVEDEDDHIVFSGKYVLLANFTFALFLSYLFCSYIKSSLPSGIHFHYVSSYKYLLQRALRI